MLLDGGRSGWFRERQTPPLFKNRIKETSHKRRREHHEIFLRSVRQKPLFPSLFFIILVTGSITVFRHLSLSFHTKYKLYSSVLSCLDLVWEVLPLRLSILAKEPWTGKIRYTIFLRACVDYNAWSEHSRRVRVSWGWKLKLGFWIITHVLTEHRQKKQPDQEFSLFLIEVPFSHFLFFSQSINLPRFTGSNICMGRSTKFTKGGGEFVDEVPQKLARTAMALCSRNKERLRWNLRFRVKTWVKILFRRTSVVAIWYLDTN